MKTIYIKEIGFNEFYKVSYSIRKSNKGYRIAHPEKVEEISRSSYYKAPASARASYRCFQRDRDVSEIGASAFIDMLEAQEG